MVRSAHGYEVADAGADALRRGGLATFNGTSASLRGPPLQKSKGPHSLTVRALSHLRNHLRPMRGSRHPRVAPEDPAGPGTFRVTSPSPSTGRGSRTAADLVAGALATIPGCIVLMAYLGFYTGIGAG